MTTEPDPSLAQIAENPAIAPWNRVMARAILEDREHAADQRGWSRRLQDRLDALEAVCRVSSDAAATKDECHNPGGVPWQQYQETCDLLDAEKARADAATVDRDAWKDESARGWAEYSRKLDELIERTAERNAATERADQAQKRHVETVTVIENELQHARDALKRYGRHDRHVALDAARNAVIEAARNDVYAADRSRTFRVLLEAIDHLATL